MENQPKQVISFRISTAEMAALEALQQPEDSSISKTALRLLQGILGAQPDTTVNAVDTDGIRDRVESLEERLNEAIISRDELTDFVNDIVDKRIRYLADALSDHENRLLNIEQAQEKQSHIPVTTEMTDEDIASLLPQEELEDAIAPELTEENVISPQAGKQLSKEELRTEANTIYTRLKRKGLKISATIIKEKILEMYPNSEDWISDDARLDVIRALEKQHK